MRLRDYEAKAVEDLGGLLGEHRRVVAVGPTGCGKTVIGAALVKRQPGKRVLWLAHRIELLRQARAELVAAGLPAREVGLLSGVEKGNESARILIASVDMFRTRLVPSADLVVVDEAHHVKADSYGSILAMLPDAEVLGLTATPQRLDGEPLGDVFTHLYTIAEAVELVALGHLLPPVVYGIPLEKAQAIAKGAAGSGADYSGRKLEAAMRKRPLMADIVREQRRLAAGVPTIVYACTRAHAWDIVGRFRKAKVTTAYLDAETPAGEREALLGPKGKLATGKVEVVVNVAVVTEGFDCPPVGCIIVARPTKSLTLWRQMCGRGARPSKGQKRFLVLDHAGNAWRHGFPDSPREWRLDGLIRGGGEMPLKRCAALLGDHQCGALNPIAARECAECGNPFPLTERELAERETELERLRAREADWAAKRALLRKLADAKGLGEKWVERALAEVA
jgi:DNA repair protein RadD